jgi:hypothetical protein
MLAETGGINPPFKRKRKNVSYSTNTWVGAAEFGLRYVTLGTSGKVDTFLFMANQKCDICVFLTNVKLILPGGLWSRLLVQ